MEVIVVLAIVAGIWWFVSNNKTSVKSETIIETKRTTKTSDGEQTITNTTVISDSQMEIKIAGQGSVYTPNLPTNHFIKNNTELFNKNNTITNNTERLIRPPKMIQQPISQPNIQLKECSNCKRTQPVTAFRPNHNQPDGLTKWCTFCLDGKEKLINPLSLQGMKVCPKCKQNRRKSSFYPSKKYPDGLSKWCKYCLK